MSTHQFVEDAPLTGVRITDSGAMVASVRCARVGIQDYAGFELGYPDRTRIRVLRPEEAVFDESSMRTYAHRPVTNDHPAEPVVPANWKTHAIGHLGDTVRRDGEYVRVDMMLSDAAAIADVQAGKVQLSAGYTASLELFDEPRDTPYGVADGAMTGFAINHVAVVDAARAGPLARIGDTAPTHWGARPITTTDAPTAPAIPTAGDPPAPTHETRVMTTKTVKVRGLDVEANLAAAQAIEQLTSDLATAVQANDAAVSAKDAAVAAAEAKAVADADAVKAAHDTAIADMATAHDTALAEKDTALAERDSKIADLEAKVLTDAQVDERVAARLALVDKATKLAKDADFTGKSDHEIKLAAVTAARGAAFTDGKSEDYIRVAFDLLDAPTGTGDPVRDALMTRTPANDAAPAGNDHGHDARVDRLKNAWK